MKKIQLGGHQKNSSIKGYALIDEEDYKKLSSYNWSYSHGYAIWAKCTNGKQENILMHRLLLNFPGGEIDHINGDRLDNRKKNLRICTREQNAYNVGKKKLNAYSKYKGVTYLKDCGRWKAAIKQNYKDICLGTYLDEVDAALAYNEKAKELFGEYANLNKVPRKSSNERPTRYRDKRKINASYYRPLVKQLYFREGWSYKQIMNKFDFKSKGKVHHLLHTENKCVQEKYNMTAHEAYQKLGVEYCNK